MNNSPESEIKNNDRNLRTVVKEQRQVMRKNSKFKERSPAVSPTESKSHGSDDQESGDSGSGSDSETITSSDEDLSSEISSVERLFKSRTLTDWCSSCNKNCETGRSGRFLTCIECKKSIRTIRISEDISDRKTFKQTLRDMRNEKRKTKEIVKNPQNNHSDASINEEKLKAISNHTKWWTEFIILNHSIWSYEDQENPQANDHGNKGINHSFSDGSDASIGVEFDKYLQLRGVPNLEDYNDDDDEPGRNNDSPNWDNNNESHEEDTDYDKRRPSFFVHSINTPQKEVAGGNAIKDGKGNQHPFNAPKDGKGTQQPFNALEDGKGSQQRPFNARKDGKGSQQQPFNALEDGKGTQQQPFNALEDGKGSQQRPFNAFEDGKGTQQQPFNAPEIGKGTQQQPSNALEDGKGTQQIPFNEYPQHPPKIGTPPRI